jgi:catalase
MVLDRRPDNFFAESEQISFGTGVLVDGLDFSADKMLVGRTFSYSDTQRHRVGPNYLQLPVNQPKGVATGVKTNQRDGAMTYDQGQGGENPTVNYEPSIIGGVREATAAGPDGAGEVHEGHVVRRQIPRTDDYTQPGQRYHLSEQWEKDDLVANLTSQLSECDRPIQERMVWHLLLADDELGSRVGDGIGIGVDDVKHLKPLASQGWGEKEQQRLDNLGHNGPRDVSGLTMTHCVPNHRKNLVDDAIAAD